MALKVVPTKGNLISTKKQLQLAVLGYDLLDKKRNVLIKEMMSLLGLISDLVTATPIDYGISIAYRSVMGVEIPKITYHKQPMVCSYNMDRSNSKVDYAYECFYRVKELTVVLAEVENSVYRLANTIRKTQKRANALKNISIPRFEETIKFISESLEEKEREEFSRQKVIKNQKH